VADGKSSEREINRRELSRGDRRYEKENSTQIICIKYFIDSLDFNFNNLVKIERVSNVHRKCLIIITILSACKTSILVSFLDVSYQRKACIISYLYFY